MTPGRLAAAGAAKVAAHPFYRLLGQDLDFEKIEPLSPAEVARILTTLVECQELIHLMVALEILSNPIPEQLERSVVQWAAALHVHERALLYARDLARGALTKAVHDFYRLNWIGDLDHRSPEFEALLRHAGDKAYALTVVADDTEAARWSDNKDSGPNLHLLRFKVSLFN